MKRILINRCSAKNSDLVNKFRNVCMFVENLRKSWELFYLRIDHGNFEHQIDYFENVKAKLNFSLQLFTYFDFWMKVLFFLF